MHIPTSASAGTRTGHPGPGHPRTGTAGVLLALSLATLSLVACGNSPAVPAAVSGPAVMPTGCGDGGPTVLAVAGHANTPAPALTTKMREAVAGAATAATPVGLVSVEGVPRLVEAGAVAADPPSDTVREANQSAFVTGVTEAVRGLRATSPHADYLGATQTAADAVRAACATGGTVYLAGSGLQDTGALDFSKSELLGADPQEVVEFLRTHRQLPDLTGIAVFLVGIGATAAPQAPLDHASRSNLTAIWTEVFKAAGATGVSVDTSPLGGPAPADVPEVTPVTVPAHQAFPATCRVRDFVLPDTGPVGFLPNVATFRDPVTAEAGLRSVADALNACPGAMITLTGTTSSAGPQTPEGAAGRRALSVDRAEAVKSLLVELGAGIDPARITTVGKGHRFAGYRNDRDAQGALLPGPAASNRSVLVSVS